MVKLEIAGFEDHAFIPVLPTAPSNETLEFLTTILTSHDGTEDVKALIVLSQSALAFLRAVRLLFLEISIFQF